MFAVSQTHSRFAMIQLRASCSSCELRALQTVRIGAQVALDESGTQCIRFRRLSELKFSSEARASVQSVVACATSFEMNDLNNQ